MNLGHRPLFIKYTHICSIIHSLPFISHSEDTQPHTRTEVTADKVITLKPVGASTSHVLSCLFSINHTAPIYNHYLAGLRSKAMAKFKAKLTKPRLISTESLNWLELCLAWHDKSPLPVYRARC
jgi:hypothetical protein